MRGDLSLKKRGKGKSPFRTKGQEQPAVDRKEAHNKKLAVKGKTKSCSFREVAALRKKKKGDGADSQTRGERMVPGEKKNEKFFRKGEKKTVPFGVTKDNSQ